MEVFADILIALGKLLIHLVEPLIWLGMGFWRWWTTELPEVLTFEEEKPKPEPLEWDTTTTPPQTYYIICIAILLLIQIILFVV